MKGFKGIQRRNSMRIQRTNRRRDSKAESEKYSSIHIVSPLGFCIYICFSAFLCNTVPHCQLHLILVSNRHCHCSLQVEVVALPYPRHQKQLCANVPISFGVSLPSFDHAATLQQWAMLSRTTHDP